MKRVSIWKNTDEDELCEQVSDWLEDFKIEIHDIKYCHHVGEDRDSFSVLVIYEIPEEK